MVVSLEWSDQLLVLGVKGIRHVREIRIGIS